MQASPLFAFRSLPPFLKPVSTPRISKLSGANRLPTDDVHSHNSSMFARREQLGDCVGKLRSRCFCRLSKHLRYHLFQRWVFDAHVFERVVGQHRGEDLRDLAAVDAEYANNATFLGDIKLMIATIVGQGLGVDRIRRT